MSLNGLGIPAPENKENKPKEAEGKVFCFRAGDIFIIEKENTVIDNTGITFPTVPPSKETLRQTHKTIGDKFEEYISTASKAQVLEVQADSFSSENLRRLRDLHQNTEPEEAPAYSLNKGGESLSVAFMKARQSNIPEPPQITGAEALAKEVNLDDILKGVSSSNTDLDESQKILNRVAKLQNTEAKPTSGNTSWARNNLKQEALPYQVVRNRAAQEEPASVRPFIQRSSSSMYGSASSSPAPLSSLPQNLLQNPNDAQNLQKTSSTLIMNQLTKSPFRETTGPKKPANETPHVIFSTTFTPAKGHIPIVPSINQAENKSASNSEPAQEAEAPKIEGTIITNPALGASLMTAVRPSTFMVQQAAKNALTGAPKQTYKMQAENIDAPSQTAALAKQMIELNLNFGGRLADSQIPIYEPILNNFYRHHLKRRIDSSSSPVKMALHEEQSAGASAILGSRLGRLQQASSYCSPAQQYQKPLTSGTSSRITAFAQKSPLFGDPEEIDDSPAYDFTRAVRPVLDFTGRLILKLDNRSLDMHPHEKAGIASLAGTGLAGGGLGRVNSAAMEDRIAVPEGPKESSGLQSGPVFNRLQSHLSSCSDADIIAGLTLMLKLNSSGAYKRQYRMASIALETAAELGIKDPRNKALIEYGMLFRDIGELEILLSQDAPEVQNAVIDYINSAEFRDAVNTDKNKFEIPGWLVQEQRPLTPKEYDLLKVHPQRGEEMLSKFASLRGLSSVIRSHHERWDGQGFPDSMKGEKIPIPSRIIAVCDAYDALTKKRRCGRKYSPAEACALIKAGSGSAFDPKCTEALIKVVKSYSTSKPASLT